MAKGIKTGGRTKGTPNKTTAQMQELLKATYEQYHAKQLQADLMAADPETRLRFMLEVAKLITPKPITDSGFNSEEPRVFTGMRVIDLGSGTNPDETTS